MRGPASAMTTLGKGRHLLRQLVGPIAGQRNFQSTQVVDELALRQTGQLGGLAQAQDFFIKQLHRQSHKNALTMLGNNRELACLSIAHQLAGAFA